jgi:hypothetical protein
LAQAFPSAKQCSAHVGSVSVASFSQRPLQQTLLVSHSMPSGRHLLGSMHVPATQKREQQSLDNVHATPCGEQFPQTPADPTSPPAPAEASAQLTAPPPPVCACGLRSAPTLRSDDAQAATQAKHARAAPAN